MDKRDLELELYHQQYMMELIGNRINTNNKLINTITQRSSQGVPEYLSQTVRETIANLQQQKREARRDLRTTRERVQWLRKQIGGSKRS